MKKTVARRLMKNLRTGKLSGYDPSVIAANKQWVEFFPEPEKPKGIVIRRMVVTGSLEVSSNGDLARHH